MVPCVSGSGFWYVRWRHLGRGKNLRVWRGVLLLTSHLRLEAALVVRSAPDPIFVFFVFSNGLGDVDNFGETNSTASVLPE